MRSGAALRPARTAAFDVLLCVALAVLASLGATVAARWARPAIIEFGPNDVAYTTGFREGWERDGATRFRWTGPHATVTVPVGIAAPGGQLRARLRRHLIEPADVTLFIGGSEVSRFAIQADPRVPYRTIEAPIPAGIAGPVVITIQSVSVNPRPLGVALDWLEIVPGARGFALSGSHLFRLALIVAFAFAAARLSGVPRAWSVLHAVAMIAASTAGTAWDVIASERIAGEGAPLFCGVAALAAVAARSSRMRAVLRLDSPVAAGALTVIALVALAARLVLVLHPQFYYPDVKVHALFAWQLARHGLWHFLREFTANQYRFSLGLQMENGHWYAFPYPPLFYMICWPFIRMMRYRPEVAVSVVAAIVNSVETWIIYGIARRLRCGTGTALAAAGAAIVLPIFTARLTLAYFPALVGHAVDMVVVLVVLAHLPELHRRRVVAGVGIVIAGALLTYTQSVLNFAVLVPLVAIAHLLVDRGVETRRRMAGLVGATALGGAIALAVFYGRYVPIFIGMHQGVPMPEERILLEKPAAPEAEAAPTTQEPDDPYAGPRFDALRGVRKAGWRMYVFYSWLAPVIVLGGILLWRAQDSSGGAFVAAWGATYFVLNFASGSLPGPNLVRYNKDLEVVAPLFCIALAMVGYALWRRSRAAAWAYAIAYAAFGTWRAAVYLTTKFVLER